MFLGLAEPGFGCAAGRQRRAEAVHADNGSLFGALCPSVQCVGKVKGLHKICLFILRDSLDENVMLILLQNRTRALGVHNLWELLS